MLSENYTILPFNFLRKKNNFILVNQTGEFISLSEFVFNKFINNELSSSEDAYSDLRSRHFLSESQKDVDLAIELLAIKLRTRKLFVSNFTTLHMIVATLRCNCRCTYCHASSVDINSKNFDMTWNIAKKTIDMIFKSPSNSLKIEYQGGEPLLNWDIIKESILYAKFLNKIAKKHIEFIICTNLLEIDEEKLVFMKKNNVLLSTSLDGLKRHHDLHRKNVYNSSSYDGFIEKLSLTRKVLGDDACSPLLTITKDNINDLKEIIDHYVSLGFYNIFLRSLNPYGNAQKNYDDLSYTNTEFIEAYKKALQYIIKLNLDGKHIVESYAALLLNRILTPFPTGFVDLQSPSGAGISGAIYDYNGEVYPADEARMLSRMGDKAFCMGNVLVDDYKKVFSGSVIKNIVANSCVETMPICADCVYQQYCGADPIRNYLETGDIVGNRLTSGFCEKNKAIIDYLLSLILDNNQETMNVFWSWITKRDLREIQLEKH